MNNAIREMMSHLKDFAAGTEAVDAVAVNGDLTISDKIVHSGDTNTTSAFQIRLLKREAEKELLQMAIGVGITSPEALTHIAGATADADGSLGSQSPQLIIEGGNNNNPFELGMDNSGATAVAFLQSRNKAAGVQFYRSTRRWQCGRRSCNTNKNA